MNKATYLFFQIWFKYHQYNRQRYKNLHERKQYKILAVKVVGNAIILGQPDKPEKKNALNLFSRRCVEKYNFSLPFFNTEISWSFYFSAGLRWLRSLHLSLLLLLFYYFNSTKCRVRGGDVWAGILLLLLPVFSK